MSHRHYCGVEGHDWVCTDSTCECICGGTMEHGDHSECAVELRDCPEHSEQNPEPSDDDSLPNYFLQAAAHGAERPRCECGCSEANRDEVVGSCVWCSHVYVGYNARVEAEHFLHYCSGAPAELRMVSQAKLARLN
jgi:hypothetical protein